MGDSRGWELGDSEGGMKLGGRVEKERDKDTRTRRAITLGVAEGSKAAGELPTI